MCWTHKSEKDESEWYSQKSCKKHEDYNITEWSESTSEVKELTTLEKVEIEEINTCETQKINNEFWIYLDINSCIENSSDNTETELSREYCDTVEKEFLKYKEELLQKQKKTENWASESQEKTMKSKRERSVWEV
jgi:hypothetical protein